MGSIVRTSPHRDRTVARAARVQAAEHAATRRSAASLTDQDSTFNERLAAIARALFHEPDVQATLNRTVADAASTLEGAPYASVTQDTFHIQDMTTEHRYGDWSRRVVEETGIRSSLSLQLFTDPEAVVSLGSLNLYSPRPQSFDSDTRAEATAIAAHAAIALQNAQTHAHLRSGLVTRTVIGQAEGILMERLKLSPDQAFALLSRLSQKSNVKLRDGPAPWSRPASSPAAESTVDGAAR